MLMHHYLIRHSSNMFYAEKYLEKCPNEYPRPKAGSSKSAEIMKNHVFSTKLKLPKTVPRCSRTTQGMPTGLETISPTVSDLLNDLLWLMKTDG